MATPFGDDHIEDRDNSLLPGKAEQSRQFLRIEGRKNQISADTQNSGLADQIARNIGDTEVRIGTKGVNVTPVLAQDGQDYGLRRTGKVGVTQDSFESFGAEILQLCVRVGGVLSGEHGIGVEKRDLMPYMFTDADLDTQERVKAAFDPRQLLNPGKVFPLLRRCIPGGSMHVHAGELPFPGLERF